MKNLLLIAITLCHINIHGQIIINEVQSSNSRTVSDDNGDYDDWIELHNPTEDTINIGGLVLKDRIDTWAIPDNTSLPPDGYLILWADDNETQGHFHTNFKLASDGEFLGLYETDSTTVIDSLTLPTIESNDSYKRCNSEWTITNDPTPLSNNNCEVGLSNKQELESNFYIMIENNRRILIKTSNHSTNNEVRVFTVNGTEVLDKQFIDKTTLNLSHFNNNVYILKISNSETNFFQKLYLP